MKTVFVANKSTYGGEFMDECNTLDELKRSIVAHEYRWDKLNGQKYTSEMYSEELFDTILGYKLFEVNLDDSERIVWGEYDGQSWFTIEKKNKNLLSTEKRVG